MSTEDLPVLFLTQAYPDHPGAYRGIFIKNLAERLALKKYPVIVITPRIGSEALRHEKSDRVEVFRFFFPSDKPLIAYRGIPIFRMIVYMTTCLFRSIIVMKQKGCRLIHVHWIHPNGAIGVLLKALFRVPLVVHARGSDFHTFAERNRFFTLLTRFVLKHSDWIFCTSEDIKRGIIKVFLDLEAKNISVAYNDVDASQFSPISVKEARRKLNIRENDLCFLFVGNLVREKGVLELLEVITELIKRKEADNFFLHYIGTGPLYDKLRELIKNNGFTERINVHGAVPPSQIPLWMNASDLLILPSEKEGMPNVVLEALSCGIPVLSTNVGDVAKFIRNKENGYLIKASGIKKSLSDHLEYLIDNPSVLKNMKDELRKRILQSNGFPNWRDEIVRVYDRLLKKI